jgi:DNA-binding FrmR family transcriptional regulator
MILDIPLWGIENRDMPKGVPKNKTTKNAILHRMKIASGHLRKVIEMVDNDKYCIDVIDQIVAVQSALGEVNKVILKNHLQSCVADAFEKGETTEAVDEVMKVMGKMSK